MVSEAVNAKSFGIYECFAFLRGFVSEGVAFCEIVVRLTSCALVNVRALFSEVSLSGGVRGFVELRARFWFRGVERSYALIDEAH